MSALALGFIGLLIGVAIFSDGARALTGAAVGAALGVALGSILNLVRQQSALSAKLGALESELKALRSRPDAPAAARCALDLQDAMGGLDLEAVGLPVPKM